MPKLYPQTTAFLSGANLFNPMLAFTEQLEFSLTNHSLALVSV